MRSVSVVKYLLLLYIWWLVVRCFITDYYSIPTSSMMPTLHPGDKVFVNKLIAGARIYTKFNFNIDGVELESWRLKGLRKVKHNDIVVFNFPHHVGKINFVINNVFCKRVVAIPGDSIYVENGFYKNNNYEGILGIEEEQHKFSEIPDSLLSYEILNTYPFDKEHFLSTTKNMSPIYIPRKGDIIRITPYEAAYYKIQLEWETKKKMTWDWEKNTVYADGKQLFWHRFKHDYYFMAGDNVSDSNDSRYWGLVPEEYIVGIVGYVYHKNKG
ncbi:signal peptidase I [Prevotella sp.]